jgi:RNA polymerase sigma-70 factor, ECF subfamily
MRITTFSLLLRFRRDSSGTTVAKSLHGAGSYPIVSTLGTDQRSNQSCRVLLTLWVASGRQPPRSRRHSSSGHRTRRGVNGYENCPSSDAVLVVAVARRDQGALAELYRRHGGSLFCAALRVLSVRSLAEAAVQDVFIRLWENPERFDPTRGSLRSLMLAQCHSRAVDIVRTESAQRRGEDGDADARRAHHVLGDEVLDFVSGQELREAVATLSESEQQAICLAYFGGHSYLEVASLLGLPEATVKSCIRSGLIRLRGAVVQAGVDPREANAATV